MVESPIDLWRKKYNAFEEPEYVVEFGLLVEAEVPQARLQLEGLSADLWHCLYLGLTNSIELKYWDRTMMGPWRQLERFRTMPDSVRSVFIDAVLELDAAAAVAVARTHPEPETFSIREIAVALSRCGFDSMSLWSSHSSQDPEVHYGSAWFRAQEGAGYVSRYFCSNKERTVFWWSESDFKSADPFAVIRYAKENWVRVAEMRDESMYSTVLLGSPDTELLSAEELTEDDRQQMLRMDDALV